MADNFTDTFTKEETLKALRCCYSDEDLCLICPYENTMTSCTQLLKRDTFDIIDHQKAEVERLNKKVEELSDVLSDTIRIRYAEAKSAVCTEFAEKLKNKWFDKHYDSPDIDFDDFIDSLLKEMVG